MKKKIEQLVYKALYSSELGFHIARYFLLIKRIFDSRLYLSDKKSLEKQFKISHEYALDLQNPKTLNEKMQWLKLYDRNPLHTLCADKFAVREFFKKQYGTNGLIELVFNTTNWKEIKHENMPDFPFIIKPNHASGWYHIIEDKNKVDWNKIKTDCRLWLSTNYYPAQREWQYKNIKPRIIVEKLLIRKDGSIPTNYRIHCFHGKVGLIALTIYFGKGTSNYKNLKYDRNWELLPIDWAKKNTNLDKIRSTTGIPRPKSLDKMIRLAEEISKDFKYVRVDFYDVDDKIYHGEITFHDGGGFECITPFEWDLKLGEMIDLTR